MAVDATSKCVFHQLLIVGRYINHSSQPNLIHVAYQTPAVYDFIDFHATKRTNREQEIFYDYSSEFWKTVHTLSSKFSHAQYTQKTLSTKTQWQTPISFGAKRSFLNLLKRLVQKSNMLSSENSNAQLENLIRSFKKFKRLDQKVQTKFCRSR